jgi:hypothetical protein
MPRFIRAVIRAAVSENGLDLSYALAAEVKKGAEVLKLRDETGLPT